LRKPPRTFQKITGRPLVCTKLPGTIRGFAMWSKGQRGGAAGEIPARPTVGLAGEVARMEEGFTLARLRTGVWAETSPASSRGGAGRRWPPAAPMPALHGQRRMVMEPARFTRYSGRRGGGREAGESSGRGSSACARMAERRRSMCWGDGRGKALK
jgi:hypothetical protein